MMKSSFVEVTLQYTYNVNALHYINTIIKSIMPKYRGNTMRTSILNKVTLNIL